MTLNVEQHLLMGQNILNPLSQFQNDSNWLSQNVRI